MEQYLYIGVILTATVSIVTLTVQVFVLLARRRRAMDYNRYVAEQYTDHGKPTPALLGRIQCSYIEQYNNYRARRVVLSQFFSPLPPQGEF